MPDALLRLALRNAISQVRFLRPVSAADADPLTGAVYRQLATDFGMLAPPVALHAAVPELLAGCWIMLRESLIADGPVPRGTLEAVAAGVSAGNACPYCVTVHRSTGQALPDGPGSAVVAEVESWARLAAHRDTAGPPPVAAARLIGVSTTFHYLNRMVNVFLPDSPLPSMLPGALRPSVLRVFGRFAGGTASRPHPAGESLPLLPAATGRRPAWAAGDPVLADGFGRAAAAIDRVAATQVPSSVRQLLTELLRDWDGRHAAVDSQWLAEPVAGLPIVDRPAGRLVLLTAFASYRIGENHVAQFRQGNPGDAALLGLTSWASMAAAHRVASWTPVDQLSKPADHPSHQPVDHPSNT